MGGVDIFLLYGWVGGVRGGVRVFVHVLWRFLYIGRLMMGSSGVVVWVMCCMCVNVSTLRGGALLVVMG